MSDIMPRKKQYKDIFSRLEYRKKEMLNEISDSLDSRRLNRFAKTRVLINAAGMVLRRQESGDPIDARFEKEVYAYCAKLCENAPRASRTERLLLALRNITAVLLIIFAITTVVGLLDAGTAHLSGIRAMQLAGGAALFILCFPMVSYRDSLRSPFNMVFPTHADNVAKSRALPKLLLYSALCIMGLIAYALCFWAYPETLTRLGLDRIVLNMPVLTIACAAVFLAFSFTERYFSVRNFRYSDTAAEDFRFFNGQ